MEMTMIIDTFWVLLTAILVFFMNLGFASLEAGFGRSKNTVNIHEFPKSGRCYAYSCNNQHLCNCRRSYFYGCFMDLYWKTGFGHDD